MLVVFLLNLLSYGELVMDSCVVESFSNEVNKGMDGWFLVLV